MDPIPLQQIDDHGEPKSASEPVGRASLPAAPSPLDHFKSQSLEAWVTETLRTVFDPEVVDVNWDLGVKEGAQRLGYPGFEGLGFEVVERRGGGGRGRPPHLGSLARWRSLARFDGFGGRIRLGAFVDLLKRDGVH